MQDLINGLASLQIRGPSTDLPTSSISLVSHIHGRMRREERGIERRQLQEAVKYGRKERANPGRDGRIRWRYTYNGVVYITDETSRHEITSWKESEALEGPPPVALPAGGSTNWHVVMVVDHSGSMRANDVPGYPTRLAAVYDCLARDLIEPQLKLGIGQVEVSLIEMGDEATVAVQRCPANNQLLRYVEGCATRRARSHGNYVPALDAALELLAGDAARQNQLFLVFLSDGAPSDHGNWWYVCDHGYSVWSTWRGSGSKSNCPLSCFSGSLQQRVLQLCVDRVEEIGDLLGRDRVHIHTVAFGPPSEDYAVLQGMAKVLPRSSFQKLGLSASCLRTAFASLTSSLATLRTVAAVPGAGLTLRSDIGHLAQRQAYAERSQLTNGAGWDLYCGSKCVHKRQYSLHTGNFVNVPYTSSEPFATELERRHPGRVQRGVAHAAYKFAEGAERVVYQCTEVVSLDGGHTAYCIGPRLVAKSTRFNEHLSDAQFHRTFCRTQSEAEELAQLFNRRLRGGPEWQIRFLPCFVYGVVDRANRVTEFLVEEELEGKFTKWNNNAGAVAQGSRGANNTVMGAIYEDDEEDEDEEEGEEVSSGTGSIAVRDVPQAFSHFTYVNTNGKKLVCDLQGVWNPVDGFTMTDPVIHHISGSKRNGATDKGPAGIRNFFATHVCGPLCARLGLPRGSYV